MAQQSGAFVDNNFVNGLITEATGLNFPPNACTETYDCEFNVDGSVNRRLGFDFEQGFSTKTIDRTNSVVASYLWRNVSGDGDVTVVVLQVGNTLYFYKTTEDAFSDGAISDTVTLTSVTSAPTPETIECQFSDGNGLLFVTHPYCDPFYVEYDTSTDTVTSTTITINIRDFEGSTADSLDVDERPTTTLAAMDADHEYNLRNQGWNTTNLTAWDTAQTTMPSNSDVMWRFKDSSDDFSAADADIARVVSGNTPAPKGHFILELANQDRDTAAGTSGVTSTTTGTQRPSTSAFFAGRLFFAGINKPGFNSKIYFSQIVERNTQYGECYQVNDPTSEDLFDLLPSDGGVISIPDAGTIIKLWAVPGGLAIFAANGVWFITGSTGLGFTANDYVIQRLSELQTISPTSFVAIAGFPSWWTADGIYLMVANSNSNLPAIQNITQQKIKTFFDNIPLSSKRRARGIYHPTSGHVRWLYKSTDTSQLTEAYEFDRILNFNVTTGAFFPWTVSDSDVKINSFIVSNLALGSISSETVVDGSAATVIDGDSNTVIAFTESGLTVNPFDKYIVSYADNSSYKFTFADRVNADYLDWFTYDLTGKDFTSYFITGYKVLGNAIRKFQTNWVRIFSRITEQVTYNFQGVWDFANTGSSTGRWSGLSQSVVHTDEDYDIASKRLKVRGHGLALQFKVSSSKGEPFDVIGWGVFTTTNNLP